MDKGIENPIGISGGFKATVAAPLGIDRRERFGADIDTRFICVGTFWHKAINQHAISTKVVDGRAIFIHQPVATIIRAHDPFQISTKRIKFQGITKEIDRRFVSVSHPALTRQIGQAANRLTGSGGQRDTFGQCDGVAGWIHFKAHPLGLIARQSKGAVGDAIPIHIDRFGVRATIGVGDEGQITIIWVDSFKVEPRETTKIDRLAGGGCAKKGQIGKFEQLQRSLGAIPIFIAQRGQCNHFAGLEVDDGECVVLLQSDPSRRRVG